MIQTPVEWLEASWQMIETTLTTWTVADLTQTYRHIREGKMYVVSRQWTIWRIMSHDLHHGGELAILLGLQGIEIPDLGDRGGHLTELSLAEPVWPGQIMGFAAGRNQPRLVTGQEGRGIETRFALRR